VWHVEDAEERIELASFDFYRIKRCFLKIQSRIPWVELGLVSVAEIAENVDFPPAVGEKLCVEFV